MRIERSAPKATLVTHSGPQEQDGVPFSMTRVNGS